MLSYLFLAAISILAIGDWAKSRRDQRDTRQPSAVEPGQMCRLRMPDRVGVLLFLRSADLTRWLEMTAIGETGGALHNELFARGQLESVKTNERALVLRWQEDRLQVETRSYGGKRVKGWVSRDWVFRDDKERGG